jgi:hypothetical protein
MQASRRAMKRGWGQSVHGTNFKFGFWRWLWAIITGNRVLFCANQNKVENPPIRLIYKRTGKPVDICHGFWSHKAGDEIWTSAVTKGYVCKHPKCLEYAQRNKAAHDEAMSNPEIRREIVSVVSTIGETKGLQYDYSSINGI